MTVPTTAVHCVVLPPLTVALEEGASSIQYPVSTTIPTWKVCLVTLKSPTFCRRRRTVSVHPTQELLTAATDRLDDLEGKREDLVDTIEFEEDMDDQELDAEEEGEEEGEDDDNHDDDNEGEESSSSQENLELVRIKEHVSQPSCLDW